MSIGSIFRLIVTRLMWYICWNLVFVVYNVLVVHVLRLELDSITISHVIVGLMVGGSGVPQADIFWHFAGGPPRVS